MSALPSICLITYPLLHHIVYAYLYTSMYALSYLLSLVQVLLVLQTVLVGMVNVRSIGNAPCFFTNEYTPLC